MPAPRRGRKRPQLDDVVLPRASDSFTLEFEVCNGFTNQRIALLSGLVLATEANRSVVLPDFLLNGMQPDGIEMVTANQADTVPFGLTVVLIGQHHAIQIPVIVVTSFPDAVPEALETALQSITSRQYTVVLGSALVQPGEELTREESALVDYYLGLHAQKFTGNSVSTFTAFIILERQWLGRQSLHYNGGNVPLQIFFPFYASGSD
ncbi:hypothetical protein ACK3TF_003058 [Chlorella vulgaris]